jgi:hypothetical protein
MFSLGNTLYQGTAFSRAVLRTLNDLGFSPENAVFAVAEALISNAIVPARLRVVP